MVKVLGASDACRVIRNHELNDDMVKQAIQTLGSMVKTKEAAALVAEKGAVECLMRVLTVQDWNKVNPPPLLHSLMLS